MILWRAEVSVASVNSDVDYSLPGQLRGLNLSRFSSSTGAEFSNRPGSVWPLTASIEAGLSFHDNHRDKTLLSATASQGQPIEMTRLKADTSE